MADHTPHGHVRVEERAGGRRVWVAEYRPAGEPRTCKTLGPAWVRLSGKTTARGATIWRAAHDSKPDDTYLTPAEADAALAELLKSTPKRPAQRAGSEPRPSARPARRSCTAPSTSTASRRRRCNYRVAARELKEEFPAWTPVARLDAERCDAYQEKLLTTPVKRGRREPKPLVRKTVRNRMLVIGGITGRAHAEGWIATDPMGRVTIVSDPDFNVLTAAQVEEVTTAMATVADDDTRGGMLDSGKVRKAFYRGLELAGLGWMREKDKPMTVHDPRHTFGTLGVRKAPVADI
ncbi:MAG TPA: hypothetical protein VMF55_12620 [Solirubrobacterales bacterium]|nr:hypothetical protein [Solirubrobacterales bacterium]